jgi:hypothetical protein
MNKSITFIRHNIMKPFANKMQKPLNHIHNYTLFTCSNLLCILVSVHEK